MPIQDSLQILLPSAADIGRGVIETREYPGDIYARRNNAFVLLQIEKISYSPSWARVRATIYKSGIEVTRVSGSSGTIDIQLSISESSSERLAIENLSIDTEVRFTIHFRSWQYGES